MKKEDCFFLGKISKKHGFKGELNIKLDFSSQSFKELNHLFIEIDENLVPFFISSFRFKNNNFGLLKLDDVNNDQDCIALIGKDVYIPLEFLPKDENHELYLINYLVIDSTLGALGKINKIQENNGQSLLVVEYQNKELLIPLVQAYIQKIDKKTQELYVDIPNGLIDLFL